ncbi:uncharacterized protein [Rutidosis leptorrhynchoides]|uniref:uncharacterized protein isoform X2 n=1 Tax=Rutidosis leptorrhynchoides TaxID=125765 RepID=UPI003A99ADC4
MDNRNYRSIENSFLLNLIGCLVDSQTHEIDCGRIENMCDGAKDKGGKTAIDCKIPTKGNKPRRVFEVPSSEVPIYDGHRDCNCHLFSDSNRKSLTTLHLECSDGVQFDAEPFKRKSRVVQMRYRNRIFGIRKLESNSKTLEMLKLFCEGRSKIVDYYYFDAKAVTKPYLKFKSNFFQEYQSSAFEIITAAYELEINSLIFHPLMMEQVVKLFITKTEDEVYNFFFINLKEYRDDKFNVMKQALFSYGEFFRSDWDFNLLKLKFHSLQSYKERRQWLTAHFLLRRPNFAHYYRVNLKESAAAADENEN